jgi:hypothetical protein
LIFPGGLQPGKSADLFFGGYRRQFWQVAAEVKSKKPSSQNGKNAKLPIFIQRQQSRTRQKLPLNLPLSGV